MLAAVLVVRMLMCVEVKDADASPVEKCALWCSSLGAVAALTAPGLRSGFFHTSSVAFSSAYERNDDDKGEEGPLGDRTSDRTSDAAPSDDMLRIL